MKTSILFCALIFIIGCNNSQQKNNITENNVSVRDTFDNLKEALLSPNKAVVLYLSFSTDTGKNGGEMKHLPAQIGTLTHLKVLQIQCLEKLEDLPQEIGNLKSLEELIIDNGNGCSMNVTIPSSICQLTNLKKLLLYGALDYRDIGEKEDTTKIKPLPSTIANLQNLEELDMGRNGLKTIPSVVWSLKKLKKLSLDCNNIKEIPSSILNLTNLQELSIVCDYDIKLPECLNTMKGLKVHVQEFNPMASTKEEVQLEKKKEEELQKQFPDIIFTFEECD
jgi:Leucine-rich repeat (LRR) protein